MTHTIKETEDLDDIMKEWFNSDDSDDNYELVDKSDSDNNLDVISLDNKDLEIVNVIDNKLFTNIDYNIDYNNQQQVLPKEYLLNTITKNKNKLIKKVNVLINVINNNPHMNRFNHVIHNLLAYIDTYYDNYNCIIENDKYIDYDDNQVNSVKIDYKKIKNQIEDISDIFDYLK